MRRDLRDARETCRGRLPPISSSASSASMGSSQSPQTDARRAWPMRSSRRWGSCNASCSRISSCARCVALLRQFDIERIEALLRRARRRPYRSAARLDVVADFLPDFACRPPRPYRRGSGRWPSSCRPIPCCGSPRATACRNDVVQMRHLMDERLRLCSVVHSWKCEGFNAISSVISLPSDGAEATASEIAVGRLAPLHGDEAPGQRPAKSAC